MHAEMFVFSTNEFSTRGFLIFSRKGETHCSSTYSYFYTSLYFLSLSPFTYPPCLAIFNKRYGAGVSLRRATTRGLIRGVTF